MFLSSFLREEGRLAALTGDTTGPSGPIVTTSRSAPIQNRSRRPKCGRSRQRSPRSARAAMLARTNVAAASEVDLQDPSLGSHQPTRITAGKCDRPKIDDIRNERPGAALVVRPGRAARPGGDDAPVAVPVLPETMESGVTRRGVMHVGRAEGGTGEGRGRRERPCLPAVARHRHVLGGAGILQVAADENTVVRDYGRRC